MTPTSFDLVRDKSQVEVFLFSGYSENNFIADISIALDSYKSYGVPESNIHCFIPAKVLPQFTEMLISAKYSSPCHKCEDFYSILGQSSNKYAIFVFTGHGGPFGVGCEQGIPPIDFSAYNLISTIGSKSHLELGIIVFGPCFSGIYNFVDTYNQSAKLCIIGATNLHMSLLVSMNTSSPILNVFLNFFHEWIKSPIDIDGDSKCTLLDGYKFAAIKTNEFLASQRTSWHRAFDLLKSEFDQKCRLLYYDTSNQTLKTDVDAIAKNMQHVLSLIYTSQEPWILNSNQFRHVSF
jgi:hypothetical protein